MTNAPLTLGGVAFKNMEVPEKINFGGKQRLAIQNLIGGGRVISTLGLDDGTISFSGIFSGADAVSRAQQLDVARALGAQLPLVWNGFYYVVVIEQFTAEYQKPGLIPFSITCVVVTDPLAAAANLVAPIANIVANDVASAVALSGQAGVSLQGVSASSLSGLNVARIALGRNMAATQASLGNAAAGLNGAVEPQDGIVALENLNTASGLLAGQATMKGYVERAAVNLGNML